MRLGLAVCGMVAVGLMALSAIGCGGGSGAPPEGKRHVLLLTIDTLRPDYLSSQGYDLPTTPAIDALYGSATVFTHAVTPIPRTTQALASMLTGLYPHSTRVRTLVDPLAPDVTPLGVVARGQGYHTVAVVSNHIVTPERDLQRGFDRYDFADDSRSAEQTTAAAVDALEGLGPDDAVFLWVHYIDPHVPYYPEKGTVEAFTPDYDGRYRWHFGAVYGGTGNKAYPEDLPKQQAVFQNDLPDSVNAHIRRLYAADIRDTDDAVAKLLSQLRSRFGDDWTVVFASDHGESLGEHDFYYDHGDYVYNASTRVPLAISVPGGRHRIVHDWVSLVDVAPTLIDIMQWDVPSAVTSRFEGRSLAPYLDGGHLRPRPHFAECGRSYFPDMVRGRVRFDIEGRFRAVWLGEWKLIWTPFQEGAAEFQLYNVTEDPHETRDLSSEQPEWVASLMESLAAWVEKDGDTARPELSDEEYQRLKSLGYVK